jgi:hypothetical protein
MRKPNDKLHPLFIAALYGSVLGFMVNAFIEAMDIPDVHWSTTTNECVSVVNHKEDGEFSCENFPKKYNKVWVK